MKKIKIRWHGRGGQGVVTAGKLLAKAPVRIVKALEVEDL